MKKNVVVLGITGQTGSYLAEMFLNKGFSVYGMLRRSSTFSTERIDDIFTNPNLHLVYGDLSDTNSIINLVEESNPIYMINAAAQSHVKASFDIPVYTFDIDATGTMRCLETLRKHSPTTKFLQCSTSELFGSSPPPQNEKTPFHPRSPYGAAKIGAYWATVNYREAYGMFACNSISFNHEGPRRSETFVTRKVTRAATKIKMGLQDKLVLGNLDARRDWSDARDICDAMYLMLTADNACDYVISSGEMRSVKQLVEMVFSKLDLDWKQYVVTDPRYLRPAEVEALCGDSSKIRKELGWEPKISFEQMIDEMIEYDLKLAQGEKLLKGFVD